MADTNATAAAAAAAAAEAQLFQTIRDFTVVNLNLVATLTWVAYDIFITLDQEIERMWGSKISLPAFVYFSTRYYGLFYLIWATYTETNLNLTAKFCKSWGPFEAAGVQFLSLCTNGLLAIRVDAFYNRNRRVRIFLIVIFLAEFVIEFALSTLTGTSSGPAAVHPPGIPLPGCFATGSPRFGLIAWIVNLTYQSLCFVLALYKFFTAFNGEITNSRLASMFVRDGALFFLMMACANVLNIILGYGVPESPLLNLCTPWLIATFTVGAPRIILNLKGAARTTGYTSEFEMHVRTLGASQTTVVFAPGPNRRRHEEESEDMEMHDIA